MAPFDLVSNYPSGLFEAVRGSKRQMDTCDETILNKPEYNTFPQRAAGIFSGAGIGSLPDKVFAMRISLFS